MIILWCRRCDTRLEAVTEFPTVCVACGLRPASWTSFQPATQPSQPFRNSVDDRAFLATLKIDGTD